MSLATLPAIAPDGVVSFEINPGTLHQFLESRAEGGPRLKCFEGSVTLVSPGMPHEFDLDRIASLVLAICYELKIKHTSLLSTTWKLPPGAGDTAYEADAAYDIQSHDWARDNQPPDLAIEIVVSNPATWALDAGALLGIPELWVFETPRHRLRFFHLVTKGKQKGTYRPSPRSRAFPFQKSLDVQGQLEDPEHEAIAFHENRRQWARRVLAPRRQLADEGD